MAAIAQEAETPRTDASGNYSTAAVPGNRGNTYPNKMWLVVANQLNCRVSPNGAVRSSIASGAIITADFVEQEAIVNHEGSSWLRITGTDPFIYRYRGQGSLGTCFVRANQRYITPVNGGALEAFILRNPAADDFWTWD